MYYYRKITGDGLASYDEIANAEADHTGEAEITEEEFIRLSNDTRERKDDSDD